MAKDSKQGAYVPTESSVPKAVRLGLISAASAIAGGLAVAWWYRKTLTKFQNPIETADLQELESDDGEV